MEEEKVVVDVYEVRQYSRPSAKVYDMIYFISATDVGLFVEETYTTQRVGLPNPMLKIHKIKTDNFTVYKIAKENSEHIRNGNADEITMIVRMH